MALFNALVLRAASLRTVLEVDLLFQVEWTCVGTEDGLQVLVDDVHVPVGVGKRSHWHLTHFWH